MSSYILIPQIFTDLLFIIKPTIIIQIFRHVLFASQRLSRFLSKKKKMKKRTKKYKYVKRKKCGKRHKFTKKG